MESIFQEEQRFTHWYLWLLLGAVTLIPLFGIIQQIGLGLPFGNNPISDTGLILLAVALLVPLILFAALKMITTIDEQGISLHFFPFLRRWHEWSGLQSAEVLDYGSAGGWGIREDRKYGTVYNVKGSQGLQLKLNNGKQLVIGTQKPEGVKAYLHGIAKINSLDLDEFAPRLEKLLDKKKRF